MSEISHGLGGSGGARVYMLSRHLLPLWLAGCMVLAPPARAEAALEPVEFDLGEAAVTPAATEPGPAEALLLTAAAAEPAQPDADAPDGQSPTSDPQGDLSFGEHVKSIKTELAVGFAYMTAVNLTKIAARGHLDSFTFHDEGLFGRDTRTLGMDKLVHAHNTYILSELIGARIRRNTGTTRGTAVSGALLASGLMLYSEMFDGFKSGFGLHDLAFNSLGAGVSVLRNTTPGLEEKVDFRVLIIPNDRIYTPTGRSHYRQLRYLFALELAGFDAFENSPLRFVELHAGYYGKGFTRSERNRGEPLERKLFVGVGLNLNQVLFGKSPRSRTARAGSQLLDYWQPPYTYIHVD